MDMERNLFDLVQDFVPEDELAEDKSEAVAMERIKFRVFQKKGVKRMRYKGLKRLAAAAAAVLVLAGGVVTVDAATDGKITKGIKEITLTIISPDGSSKKIEPSSYIKEEDGTYRIEIDDNSEVIVNDDVMENYSLEIEKEESVKDKEEEISIKTTIKDKDREEKEENRETDSDKNADVESSDEK